MRTLAPALLILVAGCATALQPVAPVGEWGGVHIGLRLGPAGGTLEYDCAHGTIGPLAIGPGGRFTALGTHTPGHGGPMRVGEVLPSWRTTYSGVIRGDRMTLRGALETAVILGPFDLSRGAQPMLLRCL